MLAVPLQTGGGLLLASLITGLVIIVSIVNSIEIVDADESRALYVFGEFEAVLEPGLNFVPPFVSNTKPIPTGLQRLEFDLDEIETADGTPCSVLVRTEVKLVDVETALTDVEDYQSAFADAVRSMSHNAVRAAEMETLRNDSRQLERQLRTDLSNTVEDWGLIVPAVELDITTRPAATNW